MKPDIITFGETMVIFDPTYQGPLRYVHQFHKRFGGAESNVAIGLTRLGHTTGWISQVGDDELGSYLINSIRGEGVDTSQVKISKEAPTGLYVKEKIRDDATNVYYYRAGSAASEMSVEVIDWDYLKQSKIVHISGITPFLSKSCFEMTMEIVSFARQQGITISFDPNLRHKIISKFSDHKNDLRYLASQADLFMPGIEEAEYLLGEGSPEELMDASLTLGAKQVILKDGENGSHFASKNERGFVKSIKVDKVIDPIGAGDGFAAGVLSGVLEGMKLEDAVYRGAVVGARVVSMQGDIEGLPTKRELKQFTQLSKDVIR